MFTPSVRAVLRQSLYSLIASLCIVSEGMQLAWSAPVIPILRSENSSMKMTRLDEFWLNNCYVLGKLLGLFSAIFFICNIGLRKSMMVASFLSLIAWIMLGVANDVKFLQLARVIFGIAGEISCVAAFMFIGEVAEARVRGFLEGLISVLEMSGIVIIQSTAPYFPLHISSIIGGVLVIIQFFALPFIPESPCYLLKTPRVDEAKRALLKRSTWDEVESELEELEEKIDETMDRGSKEKWSNFFTILKINRYAITIGIVLIVCQPFSGYVLMMMNLQSILIEGDLTDLTPNRVGIIFSLLLFSSAIAGFTLVDKFGRRVLLIISGGLTGTTTLLIAFYFTLKYLGVDMKKASWILAASSMLFACSFKLGLGIVPQLLVIELFPPDIKVAVFVCGGLLYYMSASLSLILYHYLVFKYDLSAPFFIFSIVGFACALFTAAYVPGTKSKSLKEIQAMLHMRDQEK